MDHNLFVQKYEEPKQQRGVRLTDFTWERLNQIAQEQGCTRADVIEQFCRGPLLGQATLVNLTPRQEAESYAEQITKGEIPLLDGRSVRPRDRSLVRRSLDTLLERIYTSA